MDTLLRSRISLKNPWHFLALGFGSGLAPVAPGTFGTLAAIPFVLVFALLPDTWFAALAVFFALAGFYICGRTARDMRVHDHSSIVWDEVVGYMIGMIAVPLSFNTIVTAFVLFRFFDIVKPWPISYLDKHIHGGVGIMADDILAGVFTFICMQVLLYLQWLN
ncbi:phosphatidylglycerophosphatase A [Neptunicella marina]|uniref:Phosphatidylglycerophosphatase A n=1 Tax=Neptunicella marina TaxID=2125989 RepID=A0A8J6ISE8_9ALTE|nr:phosphatidylglycerophosphatase A [Neptunicella marina]MBC3764548.1 phosphatidylglycerophosphatase A [Neptunicella marina]